MLLDFLDLITFCLYFLFPSSLLFLIWPILIPLVVAFPQYGILGWEESAAGQFQKSVGSRLF